MKKILTYVVTEQEEGQRLERILKRQMELMPQEISQAKFRQQGICVNGSPAKVNAVVLSGDKVEICLEEECKASDQLLPMQGELEILYEDEDVLAVNKPSGLVCHPTGGHYQDTLANIMQYYFQEQRQRVVIRMIGRLDQETSGVVLAAKSQVAAGRLNRQKEAGILKKEYLALVEGCPKEKRGTILEPIGPACKNGTGRDEIKMQVTSDGKEACTHYEVLETRNDTSLVRLRLETGRTHQIRVHMAYLGCPLLGDTLYNPGTAHGFSRAALHAVQLEFDQPFAKRKKSLSAPFPEDFRRYLQEAGFASVMAGL